MEYYKAHYKDEHHDVDIVIENTQGEYKTSPLSFTLDGVTFRGTSLGDFELANPEQYEEAREKFRILKHGGYNELVQDTFPYFYALQGYGLDLKMPIKLIRKSDNQEVSAELKLAFSYKKRDDEKTKRGICYLYDGERIYPDNCEVEEFVLLVEDELYSSSRKTLYFESALLDISRQMQEKYYLKCCFTCQYSEYSTYGNDDFGNMLCYRRHKEACLKVNSKDDYFEYLDDKDFDIYQETYLCEEYAERRQSSGYRGFVEGVR